MKNSEINFIGMPKTIDNDLCMTDHTHGLPIYSKLV